MSLARAFLSEFDHEMISTRKCLERTPEAKLDWQPHPTSMSYRRLASHIAEILTWARETIRRSELDLAPPGGEPMKAFVANSVAELIEFFDRSAAEAREALASAEDGALMQDWTLLMGGKTVLKMPRAAILRGFVLSHLIHHRGQLTVYMRSNGVPVPSVYGPSGDEGQFGTR